MLVADLVVQGNELPEIFHIFMLLEIYECKSQVRVVYDLAILLDLLHSPLFQVREVVIGAVTELLLGDLK